MSKRTTKPTTPEERARWRQHTKEHGPLAGDFARRLLDDVGSLEAENERMREAITEALSSIDDGDGWLSRDHSKEDQLRAALCCDIFAATGNTHRGGCDGKPRITSEPKLLTKEACDTGVYSAGDDGALHYAVDGCETSVEAYAQHVTVTVRVLEAELAQARGLLERAMKIGTHLMSARDERVLRDDTKAWLAAHPKDTPQTGG
jgi:hypothetical protein